mmetsp:Transcript_14971/g.52541  ORF Transcript_14971/g.52541 Transcript_14971/m.52541 type:complete len:218 (+) Transcript_14971:165-818(+)
MVVPVRHVTIRRGDLSESGKPLSAHSDNLWKVIVLRKVQDLQGHRLTHAPRSRRHLAALGVRRRREGVSVEVAGAGLRGGRLGGGCPGGGRRQPKPLCAPWHLRLLGIHASVRPCRVAMVKAVPRPAGSVPIACQARVGMGAETRTRRVSRRPRMLVSNPDLDRCLALQMAAVLHVLIVRGGALFDRRERSAHRVLASPPPSGSSGAARRDEPCRNI